MHRLFHWLYSSRVQESTYKRIEFASYVIANKKSLKDADFSKAQFKDYSKLSILTWETLRSEVIPVGLIQISFFA